MANEIILLVDDEMKILSSLTRSLLEEDFGDILSALNAAEALEIVNRTPEVTVIVSDYHMPGMKGIEFLEEVRRINPDITRILLTGAGDLEMAADAVNRGNVFRFLLKPCPSEVFLEAVKDGVRYHQLIVGERELLSKTLNGSIKVMVDILAVQNPFLFAQASRLRKLAHEMASALNMPDQSWEVELAALLCRIGTVTIPHEVLEKWQKGLVLKDAEADMIRSIPRMGRQLIKNVPRLERIAEAVGYQDCYFLGRITPDSPTGENIPLMARILKIIVDFDRFLENTGGARGAMQALMARQSEYDPRLLEVFRTRVLKLSDQPGDPKANFVIKERQVFVEAMRLGMVLSRDVIDKTGTLIVPKGTVINEVLLLKLKNFFRSNALTEALYIESSV
jgi:response regulator RpfG family c-di-GMP phosphodiesterase